MFKKVVKAVWKRSQQAAGSLSLKQSRSREAGVRTKRERKEPATKVADNCWSHSSATAEFEHHCVQLSVEATGTNTWLVPPTWGAHVRGGCVISCRSTWQMAVIFFPNISQQSENSRSRSVRGWQKWVLVNSSLEAGGRKWERRHLGVLAWAISHSQTVISHGKWGCIRNHTKVPAPGDGWEEGTNYTISSVSLCGWKQRKWQSLEAPNWMYLF